MSWLLPVVLALLLAGLYYAVSSKPVSVDFRWPWLIAIAVLATGIAFLVHLGRQLKLLGRLTLALATFTPAMQRLSGSEAWPSAHVIHELPQTPFNLFLRRHRDVAALRCRSPRRWAWLTRRLADPACTSDRHPVPVGDFAEWQAQLLAELKLAVVSLRTCAWCAMLAPMSVLLAMSAYPPVYQRLLTSVTIFLLLLSFIATVYVVLRMEKDPMLGPMFTRDGDHLTFGGSLRALWPKFLAMGLVLVPLFAPDVWGWLHGLIRSINSFQ